MKILQRPITYTFSIGFFALSALFIGHLVKVEAVPTPPSGLEPGDVAVITPSWRANRDQYDPTYVNRIQSLDLPSEASSSVGTDWEAVRAQYNPGYLLELSQKPAKKASSGCRGH